MTLQPKPQRQYFPELDLLRFFAFFMVFLSHVVPGDPAFFTRAYVPAQCAALIIAMAAGGAFGVDLFFVLSSFLITTLLLREHGTYGTISIRSFYIRRLLRIWPLYYAFLLVATPLLQYVLPDDTMPVKYTLAYSVLAGNWACVLWGYPHSVASPLWSVSIEEQFYLTWPLAVQRWSRHIVPVAILLLACGFCTRFFLVAHGAVHPQIWCNTLARLDPIACGALVAVFAARKTLEIPTPVRIALLLTGCCVITAASRYGDFTGTQALMTFPLVAAACTLLLVATLGWPMRSEPNRVVRTCASLGRISYGLYIFHSPAIALFAVTSTYSTPGRIARTAAALLATIAVASASYRFFEGPFLRLKGQFSRIRSPNRPAALRAG